MKKLFSKTVAALLSVACMGSLLTASFDGKPLFIQESIVHAGDITFVDNPGLSFEASTGKLTLSGEIYTSIILNYSNKDMVKSIEAEEGTILKPNSNAVFMGYSKAETMDLSNVNTSQITDMTFMFSNCTNLKSLNLSGLNTKKVTSMAGMFENCSSLESLDLSGFDTKNVTNMGFMFEDCSSLESLDLSVFNTQNVKNMRRMFSGCKKLNYLNVSSFDTKKVCDMGAMFENCSSLKQIELNNFNTENVLGMGHMFYGCSGIDDTLDISSFDTKKVNQMNYMFAKCSKLKTIKVSEKWTTDSVLYGLGDLFDDCNKLVGGNGTKYDRWKRINLEYFGACIDSPETPGYFTYKTADNSPYLFEAFMTEDFESKKAPNTSGKSYSVKSYSVGDPVKVYAFDSTWVRISSDLKTNQEWVPVSCITKIAPLKAVVLKEASIKERIKNPTTKSITYSKLRTIKSDDDDSPITIYPLSSKWAKISRTENEWIQLQDVVIVPLKDTELLSEPENGTTKSNINFRNEFGKKTGVIPKNQSVTIYAKDKGWGRISPNDDSEQKWVCLSYVDFTDEKLSDSSSIDESSDSSLYMCELSPKGHTAFWKTTIEPTCISEGKEEKICMVCGKTIAEPRVIPKTENHRVEYRNERLPDLFAPGYKEAYCKDCNKRIENLDIYSSPVDYSINIGASEPNDIPRLFFNENGDVEYRDYYHTEQYNNKEVLSINFKATYDWTITAPEYVNIIDKTTNSSISSGEKDKSYTLLIWLDKDIYYKNLSDAILNEKNNSNLTQKPQITFNIEGATLPYIIDWFHINNMMVDDYIDSIKPKLDTIVKKDSKEAINYLIGKELTNNEIKVYEIKDNSFMSISSYQIDEKNIRINYMTFDTNTHLYSDHYKMQLTMLETNGMAICPDVGDGENNSIPMFFSYNDISHVDLQINDQNYSKEISKHEQRKTIAKFSANVIFGVISAYTSGGASLIAKTINSARDVVATTGISSAIDMVSDCYFEYDYNGDKMETNQNSASPYSYCQMGEGDNSKCIIVDCIGNNLIDYGIVHFIIKDTNNIEKPFTAVLENHDVVAYD